MLIKQSKFQDLHTRFEFTVDDVRDLHIFLILQLSVLRYLELAKTLQKMIFFSQSGSNSL